LAGQGVGAMKSGISRVNSCTISRALWAGTLSCQQTLLQVTALINAMETGVFCCQYLKINNFTINVYFLMKFYSFLKIYSESSACNSVRMH